MRGLRIACVLLMLWGLASIAQADLVASYESSEVPPLVVTSDEVTPQMVQGGIAGAPAATEGTQVLKCTWINQPDGKVEVRHTGVTIDLAGVNWLLADVYMTTDLFAGSSNGLVGIVPVLGSIDVKVQKARSFSISTPGDIWGPPRHQGPISAK